MDILSAYLHPPEYRKRTLRLLRSLCGSWGVLPTSYALRGEVKLLDEYPFAPASRFVEVFRGMSGGGMVAVKTLMYPLEEFSRANKVDTASHCSPLSASD